MIYCYPKFFRASGLGNRLFPWARCKIFSDRTATPMLAPHWAHIRRGPLTRGGVEYRHFLQKILLWGNFVPTATDVVGLARLKVLLSAKCRIEADLDTVGGNASGDVLVIFCGDGNHFADLQGQAPALCAALRGIASTDALACADAYPTIPIGINVRRGKDFIDAEQESDYRTRGAVRTPLIWYIKVLENIRRELGKTAKAYVVSDGTPEDLQELLRLPNVELVNSRTAIGDLLILAKCRLLIGSGGSSFSAWASFLSGAPTITHPGQSLQWFKVAATGSQYVGELALKSRPPPELLRHLDQH